MVVKLGNIYYFIGILFLALVTLLVGLLLKNKSKDKQYKILLIISFANLALHFLKLLIPEYYKGMPMNIKKITPENICAISVMTFPFILMSKNKYAKDYMFYFGILSGFCTIFFPTEAFNEKLYELDVIRFYICHTLIFVVPFYMVICGFHALKLDLKRIIMLPLSFMIVLSIILVNEIILMETGFREMRGTDFLNYTYGNPSFVFGPNSYLEKFNNKVFDPLVPNIFKKIQVGEYKGAPKYTPVLWLLVPCYVYFPIYYIGIYFLFTKVLKKGIEKE